MPTIHLACTLNFAASHFLTEYHGKCENLHGHNYKLIVEISGKLGKDGMVMDYKQIKAIAEKEVIEKLDHQHLNDIIKNPSSENLIIWIWKKLEKHLPLSKLRLYETENYYCEYEGK